jgi:hypothetical protein
MMLGPDIADLEAKGLELRSDDFFAASRFANEAEMH